MWFDDLTRDEQREINMLSGAIDLPKPDKYENLAAFLHDVRSAIIESGSLVRQASKLLGEA